MNTSPGFMVSAGNFSRKARTVAGRHPMKPGRLMVDCASERPCASVSTMAKSLPSRTSVEKQVRMNAAEASSTTLIRRFQRISSSIGSNVETRLLPSIVRGSSARLLFISIELLDHDGDRQIGTDHHVGHDRDDDGRFTLFEDQRGLQRFAGCNGIAVVNLDLGVIALQRQIDLARAGRG